MGKAAEYLGITERIMGLRMKKYGIDYRTFREKADGNGYHVAVARGADVDKPKNLAKSVTVE
jgi:hypothetical protein